MKKNKNIIGLLAIMATFSTIASAEYDDYSEDTQDVSILLDGEPEQEEVEIIDSIESSTED